MFNVQRDIGNGWSYVLTLRITGRHTITINKDIDVGVAITFTYDEYNAHLIIVDIQKFSRFADCKEHLGTAVFNQLLLCLEQRGKTVRYITGRLSYVDAPSSNGNWFSSIPFYYDFPKHLSPQLSYNLEFEIKGLDMSAFPIEKSERERFILSIPVRDYQFQYAVIPKPIPSDHTIITYTTDV